MTIRPTRHALWFFAILVMMLLASITYQSNAAWLMVFLVFTTGCVSAFHGWRNVLPATLSAPPSLLLQAGDRARLLVTVSNPAKEDVMTLVLEVPDAGTNRHRLLVPHVPAGSSTRTELLLPPLSRGVHRLDTLRLSTQYPLGLFELARPAPLSVELVVHPLPAGAQHLPLAPSAELGEKSRAGGREHDLDPEDFRSLRPWRPGESPRHIDWKAVARGTGPLLIKEWSGNRAGSVHWLTWESTSGGVEARLSQLTRWVLDAQQQGLTYGLRLPGGELPPGNDAGHHQACLRLLAAHPSGRTP
jgi:uncharacterized protein (DUF58 family)